MRKLRNMIFIILMILTSYTIFPQTDVDSSKDDTTEINENKKKKGFKEKNTNKTEKKELFKKKDKVVKEEKDKETEKKILIKKREKKIVEDKEKNEEEKMKKIKKKITKEQVQQFFKDRPLILPMGIPMFSIGLICIGASIGTGVSSVVSYNDLTTQYAEYRDDPSDSKYNELETLRQQNLGTSIVTYVLLPVGIICTAGGIISFFIKKDYIDRSREKMKNKPKKENKEKKVKEKKEKPIKENLSFDIGFRGSNLNFEIGFKF